MDNATKRPTDLSISLEDEEFRRDYGEASAKYELAVAMSEARLRHGLTQKEAAQLAGVSQAYLSKLESGEANPTIGHIGAILGAWWQRLTISVGALLSDANATEITLVGSLNVQTTATGHAAMNAVSATIDDSGFALYADMGPQTYSIDMSNPSHCLAAETSPGKIMTDNLILAGVPEYAVAVGGR